MIPANQEQPRRLAIITKQAFSVCNFRGPLVRDLVARGIEVYALAPDYDDSTSAAVRALGAVPVHSPISPTGMNPLRDLCDLVRLSRRLRALKAEATLAYFIKPVIYGTLAAWLARVPARFAMIEGAGYVFSAPERPSRKRSALRKLVSWLYRISLARADRVYLLNREDRELFLSEKMVPAEKVQLLDGIGVDLDHYRCALPAPAPPCFIMIARLLREKGVYDYVQAARAVKARHPGVRFLLLGGTDANPGSVSRAEVACWTAEGVVELPGQVSDVRPWIERASVFVLPSYYREGLPRSTQEAMAMGRPVITTDSVGCRETVEEGVNGFLVPVRDPAALARAMLRFVERPELIPRMGEASRELARRRFDVRKINRQILASMGVGETAAPASPAPRVTPDKGALRRIPERLAAAPEP